ncbi:MAG: OmpA family protein [Pseudomonadota bacterium]
MSDLDELRDLLFGKEKQVLDSITERVERREMRAQDMADVLPEAVRSSHRAGKELRDALKAPVGDCLKTAFHEEPEVYGDALYPVMGPAIRKSIMQALRTFSQQINQAVEHSLTPRGLSWRLQAWRAGVPFGEFIMQKTLLYRVEQAYLISRENGLLVGHVQHEAARIKDSDAVSAMFTAIQDFVKESFSPDRTGRLESADMGEFTLWAVHGPHALLVCVIRGVPPRGLRAELSAVLERIHFRYGDTIRDYAGDTSTVPDIDDELLPCLQFEAQNAPNKNSGTSWTTWIIAMLLIGGIGYLAVTSYLQQRKLDTLVQAISETPGLIVTDASASRSSLSVSGLRDPLAPTIEQLATDAGLGDTEIVADMQPYYSLDPTISAERAAAEQRTAAADQRDELLADVERLGQQNLYFEDRTQLTPDSQIALAGYVAQLNILANSLFKAGMTIDATVVGYSDPVGGREVNAQIATDRAESVARSLTLLGWQGTTNIETVLSEQDTGTEADPTLRRVTVTLRARDSADSQ